MHLHQALDDGQAKAQSPMPPGRGSVSLPEAVEDVRQELGLNALPGVAHGDLGLAVDLAQGDPDPARARPPLRDLALELTAALIEATADEHCGTDKDQAEDNRADQRQAGSGATAASYWGQSLASLTS